MKVRLRSRGSQVRVVMGVIGVLSTAVVLSGCGRAAERAAAPDEASTSEQAPAEGSAPPAAESPSDASTQDSAAGSVQSSLATFVSLENRLAPRWARDGLSITWQVTKTQNKFWDGGSRPDAAPPKGLQGLVQSFDSGAYTTRLEVNRSASDQSFVLTPVAIVDSQQFPLSPITFSFFTAPSERRVRSGAVASGGIEISGWNMRNNDQTCDVNSADQAQTETWTERTPRGLLAYDVVLRCPGRAEGTSEVLIRTSKLG